MSQAHGLLRGAWRVPSKQPTRLRGLIRQYYCTMSIAILFTSHQDASQTTANSLWCWGCVLDSLPVALATAVGSQQNPQSWIALHFLLFSVVCPPRSLCCTHFSTPPPAITGTQKAAVQHVFCSALIESVFAGGMLRP